MKTRQKIAILGGGLGALTAAFELTENELEPDLDPGAKYDIHVYQMGWRLGGKGASGRNAETGVIQEHGLHLWSGFYDNAFDVMRRVYAAWQKVPVAGQQGRRGQPCSFETAFPPVSDVSRIFVPDLAAAASANRRWRIPFPPDNDLAPGIDAPRMDGSPGHASLDSQTPWSLGRNLLALLADHFDAHVNDAVKESPGHRRGFGLVPASVASLLAKAPYPVHEAASLLDRSSLRIAHWLAQLMPADARLHLPLHHSTLIDLVDRALAEVQEFARRFEGRNANLDLRHIAILLELGLAMLRGILADGVLLHGFDHIDDLEWTAWLKRHGCSDGTAKSAPCNACYAYVFGRRFIRPGAPAEEGREVAAGTGTRALLRLLFCSKGATYYRLYAGMGDTVFGPLYEVLRHRKVTFHFFCRVESLEPSADGRSIAAIKLSRQLPDGAPAVKDYDPLNPFGLWPDRPNLPSFALPAAQQDAARLLELESNEVAWPPESLRTLNMDKDFDHVILGIPVGALARICGALSRQHEQTWGKMITHVKTTPTIALQYWSKRSASELGWRANELCTGLPGVFSTWADMSFTLPQEKSALPAGAQGTGAHSVSYFVGVPDPAASNAAANSGPATAASLDARAQEDLRAALAAVKDLAAVSLTPEFPEFWHGDPNWCPTPYVHCARDPGEQYVLSVPGSTKYRLPADESGYDNLYLAGDWVRTGLNGGCAEAAAMAGRVAARAITGAPMFIPGLADFADPILPSPGWQPTEPASAGHRVLHAMAGAVKSISTSPFATAALGGVGQIDAVCMTAMLARATAQALLAQGLVLGPLPGELAIAPGFHPVVFAFARQSGVRPGIFPAGGLDYAEFVEFVPFVRLGNAGQSAPDSPDFSYYPYMLVSRLLPTVLGAGLYGFPKQPALFAVSPGVFSILGLSGPLEMRYGAGPGDPADETVRGRVKRILDLPIISRSPRGAWLFSRLDYDLAAGQLDRVEARARIGAPYLPQGRLEFWPTIPPLRLRAPWSLSSPLAGELVRSTADPRARLKDFAQALRRRRGGTL